MQGKKEKEKEKKKKKRKKNLSKREHINLVITKFTKKKNQITL